MNIASLNEDQKQALMDLLVLGMYADWHLSSAEDERINKLLRSFDFESDYARKQFADASFTRASRYAETTSDTKAFLTSVSTVFNTPQMRQDAFAMLGSLLASDGQFSSQESNFLSMAREIFGV
jgi:hypothetical protein